ncbi:hypothetical protein CR532_04665 (plasmid) [Candidatus Borreliella tachyglossi]|uniref:Lipoprotein n=1 Tax=Candidatus Borreliella tachyglossi TaxID=1964448 RepID=A0A2S1LYB8_9SPIR|nr:Mlp family lipoprotein [Candidatus Borreliella tachyglossi]AWG43293.1 hypothetical protein CR532_04665 [Candidatus Borreliella tachyglossi]
MKEINFMLILLLLFFSCKPYGEIMRNAGNSKVKGESKVGVKEEQATVNKKTPEEAIREKLDAKQRSDLDALKQNLKKDQFDKLLGLDEGKIKEALGHKNCGDLIQLFRGS